LFANIESLKLVGVFVIIFYSSFDFFKYSLRFYQRIFL